MSPSSERTVLVTGASGFIAAHVVRELLARGYRVRGSVRGNVSEPRFEPLRALPGAKERLTLHTADLMEEAAWPRLVAGCDAVVHTASPFTLDAPDPKRDLIDPAVAGTRHVVGTAVAAEVPRVVVTSSLAAITDEPVTDRVFTEADWNERSTITRNPYYASKAAAERAAWSLVPEGHGTRLVSINPGIVIGPSLGATLSTSNATIRDLLSGAYPMIVSLDWALVDVRDVALAHVAAVELDEANGRYLCVARPLSMEATARMLREDGLATGYRVPRLRLGGRLGDMVALAYARTRPPGLRSYLHTHIGRSLRVDGSRVTRDLGVGYRDVRVTLRDTIADLERWGHLRRRS
jgi:dihydroflavonol-4-reductase